jgi:FkbM family methyltransferase
VGDHTIAYLNAVGEGGMVYAFEPSPVAMQCLLHNCASAGDRLYPLQLALGNEFKVFPLSGNNYNYAGSYLGNHMPVANVQMVTLDSLAEKIGAIPDFIKIDIEGCELKFLRGAAKTIDKCKPVLVMEINHVALERQGDKPEEIYEWLRVHGYKTKIIQENCDIDSLMYDILCIPSGVPSGGSLSFSSAPPRDPQRRKRKKKRKYSPEALESLRRNAAKARAAQYAKRNAKVSS